MVTAPTGQRGATVYLGPRSSLEWLGMLTDAFSHRTAHVGDWCGCSGVGVGADQSICNAPTGSVDEARAEGVAAIGRCLSRHGGPPGAPARMDFSASTTDGESSHHSDDAHCRSARTGRFLLVAWPASGDAEPPGAAQTRPARSSGWRWAAAAAGGAPAT
jgi:hypothetical protein